jgi:hypothetical protein
MRRADRHRLGGICGESFNTGLDVAIVRTGAGLHVDESGAKADETREHGVCSAARHRLRSF